MSKLELMVTLWPSYEFPHFERFTKDRRLSGIRLNSAMTEEKTLTDELRYAKSMEKFVPLYFDIKGRQLRVREVYNYKDHLELTLNHPIKVKTPNVVLFKAGVDQALLTNIIDDKHLIFDGGPHFKVKEGESLHIRDPSLVVGDPIFCDYEIEKIKKAKEAGFDRFVLSYVESNREIDEFREYIGNCEVIAKIESKNGLKYVANEFRKKSNLSLMAARGDLYVEINKPHDILNATKSIIEKDPEAIVGSRMLLSLINQSVPECSDFCELAWLADIGYKRFMLCDGLCLKEEPLARAVNAFENFRRSYVDDIVYAKPSNGKGSFYERMIRKIKV